MTCVIIEHLICISNPMTIAAQRIIYTQDFLPSLGDPKHSFKVPTLNQGLFLKISNSYSIHISLLVDEAMKMTTATG